MMKYTFTFLALALLASCSENETNIEANIRIDHYKQSAIGVSPTLVYLIQEGDNVGTDEWEYLYSGIKGFDFEWGFVYDLIVDKRTIENPPADGSSIEYVLKEIVSKKSVEPGLTFDIQLKSSAKGINEIVIIGTDSEQTLLDEQIIDCLDICTDMFEYLENQDEVIGVFKHGDGKIELQELRN